MKVKNILKGKMNKFEIREITVISYEKEIVIFSGAPQNLIFPVSAMAVTAMAVTASTIMNAEVKKTLEFNNEKLFFFI